MKRILHISKYYYPFRGGTEQIAQDCVNALKDKYEQKVICFNHENGNVNNLIDDVEVVRCGCFAKIWSQSLSISYGRILKNVFKSFKPDYVIFHYPNPFVARYLLRYIPEECKLVVYWHLDIVKQKLVGKLFDGQNKKLIKKSDLLIATSPNYVEGSSWLSLAKEKCVIIPNCINEARFKPTTKSIELSKKLKQEYMDKIICLAIGRHTEYKGYKYLIQASKMLDSRFEIFIIGKGELTETLIKEAGDDKKIHFCGSVSDDELKAYLSAMDIYCFPSVTRNEAFGLALAEGMYFEKPAVTFKIAGSGVNYVSLDGVTGIEVENKNVEKYAEALNKLAESKELRMKYGAAGKHRVEQNFLFNQFRERINLAILDLEE